MATKKLEEEVKEPKFIDQAKVIIDHSFSVNINNPEFGHALKKVDIELITNVLELHEKYVDEKIINKILDHITHYYDPIVTALKKIDDTALDVEGLKEWKKGVNIDLDILKEYNEENDTWKAKKKFRIERIEANFALMEPERILEMRQYEKDINKITPVLIRIGRFLDFFNWKTNWKKIIGVILGAIVFLVLMAWAVVWYSHKKHWVSQTKTSYSIEYAYDKNGKQVRDLSPNTRGFHLFDSTRKYTQHEKDSIKDAFHEFNIQQTLKIIEETNKRLKYGSGGKAGV